ncbi:MAG: hypothetical protein ACREKL_05790 [Chthoniobacterales bacterium]
MVAVEAQEIAVEDLAIASLFLDLGMLQRYFDLMAPLVGRRDELMRDYPECYACKAKKTSMEHIPAKCFHPPDGNFRKNLIKVPSCERHNCEKAGDDLYAVIHVALLHGAQSHQTEVIDRLRRSLERDVRERGGALVRRIYAEIVGRDGSYLEGKLDVVRMKRFMRLLARGVYFYDRFERLEKPLKIAWLGNDPRDPAKVQASAEMTEHLQEPFNRLGVKDDGPNPSVFRYAIADDSENKAVLVRLTFYDSLSWWAFYHPDAEGMDLD